MLCSSAGVLAQNKTISGQVIDSKTKEAIIGALVTIKTTTLGSITDGNGKFAIVTDKNLPINLTISFLGYTAQEVEVSDALKPLTISLTEDLKTLDEIVVVGYGTAKKRDLVGSISRIGSEDIKSTPMNNSVQALLQGRSAGVNVNVSSASPSSPISVIIRGISSLSGDGQPLWVIDGVPQYSSSISGDVSNTLYNLNLNDVESLDILKDASATAIYGSRAANGVVIVTTKSGAEGINPTIEFSARTGIQKIEANKFNVLTTDEYIAFSNLAVREQAIRYGGVDSFVRRFIDQTKFNALNTSQWNKNIFDNMFLPNAYSSGKDNYWDLMTQDAKTEQYDINLRGGNKQNSYYVSFFYQNQEGIVKGTQGNTFGGRFNFEGKVRDVIKLGVNIDGTARSIDQKDDMIQDIIFMRPDYPAYKEDGTINTIDSYIRNPLITLLNKNRRENRILNASVFLEYDIFPYLKAKTTGTINYLNSKQETYNRKSYDGATSNASISEDQTYVGVWENLLTFFKTFDKHDVQAILGQSLEKNWSDGLSAAGQNFPDDNVLVNLGSAAVRSRIGSSYSASALVSAFARLQYKFNNRYLLTATYRADGSSRFGSNSRWGYFPSGGVGWILTEENFTAGIKPYVSYLKLRASIGVTGSQNLGNYGWQTLMGAATYNNLPGITPSSIGNSLLQWEQQKQTDLGIDYGLWNDKIYGSLVWYQKDVDNLLYGKPIPTSSSFTSVTQNIGAIQNNGLEFDVKVKLLNSNDLKWEVDFNIAKNKGILKRLNGVETVYGGGAYQQFKVTEGGKMGTFYGYKDAGRLFRTAEELAALLPILPTTGKQTYYRTSYYESAGDIYVLDLNGDGKITADDRTEIGDANPDFYGGGGTTLYWKGFRLNLTFTYSVGADRYWERENGTGGTSGLNVYNGLSNILKESWTMKGDGAKYPHVDYYGWGDNNVFSSRFIHDASYLRLSALNLSYRLPEHLFRKLLIQGVELTFQATNLFTLTNYPGMDPQGNFNTSNLAFYGLGYDFSTYPSARNYNLGVKFTIK
jgi:TonB-linked SusC/RagA family outer membrane protein